MHNYIDLSCIHVNKPNNFSNLWQVHKIWFNEVIRQNKEYLQELQVNKY